MRFISRDKSPGYYMKLAQQQITDTNIGKIVKMVHPALVKFKALDGEFQTRLLPTRDGVAKGILHSDEAAASLAAAGHIFTDEEGKDVTEREVIAFLLGNEDYGVHFIAIDNNSGGEIEAEASDFIPEPDGMSWCRFCKKHVDNRGASEHAKKSQEHIAAKAREQMIRNRALSA